jgi:hypothetical protein
MLVFPELPVHERLIWLLEITVAPRLEGEVVAASTEVQAESGFPSALIL